MNTDPNRNNSWQEIDRILNEALELAPADQNTFLDQACGDDVGLRREVAEMLTAMRRAQSRNFLEGDVFLAGVNAFAKRDAPARIGQYRILREIGRGGMGTVFLAERDDPRQTVAIKIIKRGMDTDEIIRRFRREKQVLASLNHSNIARLLDGGTTEDGLSYFVMEFIDGLPITDFCDRRKLSIDERLELFAKVCGAIARIHRSLVVHRDIKPSNILVTADGEPKLLDFGIAKLLSSDDFGLTIEQTVADARLLTPEYASPEQINGEQITTASDLYSLGVVLYELLSGHRPFRLRNRPTREVLEVISRQEPAAPSTAVLKTGSETSGDFSPEIVASSRSERPKGLRRKLAGDLDNITLKALKKEPERRYQTVEQFAEDVQRYLSKLPVFARPDTLRYRSLKFVKRNRLAVALTTLLGLALVFGLAATIWQSIRAQRERSLAQQRAAETRRLANSLLNEFDEEIANLASSYPTRIRLANASSEYLDRLAQQTDDREVMKELAQAHLRLHDAYHNGFGDDNEAQKHLRKAAEISRNLLAVMPNDTVVKGLYADCLEQRDDASEQNLREAVRAREEVVATSPDGFKGRSQLSESYVHLGEHLSTVNRKEEGREYYQRAFDTRKQVIGLLERKTNLSSDEYDALYWNLLFGGLIQGNYFDDWEAAAVNFRRAIEIGAAAAARFPEHRRIQTNIAAAHSYLARASANTGDYRTALEHYEIALESSKRVAQRFNLFWHATEVRYLLKIVDVLLKLGQKEQALTRLRQTLVLRREATLIDHANPRNNFMHGDVFNQAGTLFAAAGSYDEALAAYREAERAWQTSQGNSAWDADLSLAIGRVYLNIGDLYAKSRMDQPELGGVSRARSRQACDLYQRAHDIFVGSRADLHLKTGLGGSSPASDAVLADAKLNACAREINMRRPGVR